MKCSFIKIICLSLLIEISFISTGYAQDVKNQGTGTKPALQNKNLMDTLRNAIFSQNPDIAKARNMLKTIRLQEDRIWTDSIKEIQKEVKSRIVRSFVRTIDPYISIVYDLDATVLLFSINERKNLSSEAKAIHLCDIIHNELKVGNAVNAEVILLKENATYYTKGLLYVLDSTKEEKVAEIIFSVLLFSNADQLEKQLIERVNKYKGTIKLYEKILFLLSRKGSIETFYFLQKQQANDKEIRRINKMYLAKLAERIDDIQQQQQILKFLSEY